MPPDDRGRRNMTPEEREAFERQLQSEPPGAQAPDEPDPSLPASEEEMLRKDSSKRGRLGPTPPTLIPPD